MNVEDIRITDYDYPLPDANIARHPLQDRDLCRLLSVRGNKIEHKLFANLPELLPEGALLVRNNTKVIHARLQFFKATGAAIEIFLLEPFLPADYVQSFESNHTCQWTCLVGNLKKWKESPVTFTIPGSQPITLSAEKLNIPPGDDGSRIIRFSWDTKMSFAELVEKAGKIPIPPYLNRESEKSDLTDYQTIYASIQGSVAAPTAGLHFTSNTFQELANHSIDTTEVTLHVGAGTFKPVKSECIGEHPMHTETFIVSTSLLSDLINALTNNKPIIAVGTTSVRTLESLPHLALNVAAGKGWHVEQWQAYSYPPLSSETVISLLQSLNNYFEAQNIKEKTASTAIMIAPGFNWSIVNGMITNFHQPKSTLLLLVSAWLGGSHWKEIYSEAIRNNYRFLSYGDACLFLK